MASGQPAGAPSYSAYTEGVVAAAADSQGQSQGSGSEESEASGPDGKAGVRVLTEASDDSKCRSFKDMGLPPSLLKGVEGHGMESPSLVQQLCIVPMLQGEDVFVKSASGSGKSVALSIRALQCADADVPEVQVLFLAPTREWVFNLQGQAQAMAGTVPLHMHACVGGRSVLQDVQALQGGAQVVFGTPGRSLDLMQRGPLDMDALRCCILYAVDELLDMGYGETIEDILASLPAKCQILASACARGLDRLPQVARHMRQPVFVEVCHWRRAPQAAASHHSILMDTTERLEDVIEVLQLPAIKQRRVAVFFRDAEQAQQVAQAAPAADLQDVYLVTADTQAAELEAAVQAWSASTAGTLLVAGLGSGAVRLGYAEVAVHWGRPIALAGYAANLELVQSPKQGPTASILVATVEDIPELEVFLAIQMPHLPADVDSIFTQ